MPRLLSTLRNRLRGGLPDSLLRARRRFAALTTVLVVLTMGAAFWMMYQMAVERRYAEDYRMMSALAARPIQLEGDASILVPSEVVELSDDVDPEDVISYELFRLLLYPDGTYTRLDGPYAGAGVEAAEFLQEYNDSFSQDDRWRESEAGGGLYHRHGRSWSYITYALREKELRALEGGEVLDPGQLAYSQGEAAAAKVITVFETTGTEEFVRAYRHQVGQMWLALVVPTGLVCYLLARVAMRPAARAWERQQRFVLDASHELKTPLASLSADLDALVANGDETVASQRRWCDYMRADIDALAGLSYRLLEAARADAGANAGTPGGSCDAGEVAASVLGRFEARARARGVTCALEARACPRVACSAEVLADVLSALVDNAVRYADEGGRVTVEVKPLGKRTLAVCVGNSGPGIPEGDVPHVFERFWRGDTARARDEGAAAAGYGLGLAIARDRVRAFGGDIFASSAPGEWTTFTVEIPAG